MNRSDIKAKLSRGEVVFGQMVLELFTPGIGQMLANCGGEFVIYDMEHSRCDIGLAAQMFASCKGTGIVPMVRVPDLKTYPLSRVLDLGAHGVMVPRVETGEQMRGTEVRTPRQTWSSARNRPRQLCDGWSRPLFAGQRGNDCHCAYRNCARA